MKRVFTDTRPLDKACREQFGLTEDLMMENAAAALEQQLINHNARFVLILCGPGNNGGDGYALARRLNPHATFVCPVYEPKSEACKIQALRAKKVGIQTISIDKAMSILGNIDCVVDCIFGSGFHDNIDDTVTQLLTYVNRIPSIKFRLACDVPTGIDATGYIASTAFKADVTVTMGALKQSLYSDFAVNYVGEIVCASLGVASNVYKNDGNEDDHIDLLEETDIELPYREDENVNKGSFGFVTVVAGNKKGAAVLAGKAAFALGAGIVSLYGTSEKPDGFILPDDLLYSNTINPKTNVIAIGMGLGDCATDANAKQLFDTATAYVLKHKNVQCVIDGDLLGYEGLPAFLEKVSGKHLRVVLTPHPKEFQRLLKICGFGDYSIEEIGKNRIALVQEWSRKYHGVVLMLKGTRTVIGYYHEEDFDTTMTYIDALGKPCLAKAGSGDVLAGFTSALMAQELDAAYGAMSGSLVHSLASRQIKTDWGMTPEMLIEAARYLDVKNESSWV